MLGEKSTRVQTPFYGEGEIGQETRFAPEAVDLPHDSLGALSRSQLSTSRPHRVNPLKYPLGLLDRIGDGEV